MQLNYKREYKKKTLKKSQFRPSKKTIVTVSSELGTMHERTN